MNGSVYVLKATEACATRHELTISSTESGSSHVWGTRLGAEVIGLGVMYFVPYAFSPGLVSLGDLLIC